MRLALVRQPARDLCGNSRRSQSERFRASVRDQGCDGRAGGDGLRPDFWLGRDFVGDAGDRIFGHHFFGGEIAVAFSAPTWIGRFDFGHRRFSDFLRGLGYFEFKKI